MKSAYLDKEIKELERLRKEGKLSYISGERLSIYNEIKTELESINPWISVEYRLPKVKDEDYQVCVKNKNKESGIFIQDIKQFSSDGVFVGGNPDVWEKVTHWQPTLKPPTK